MPSIEKKFIPPGGELSVAPTRQCGSKPGVGGIFLSLALFCFVLFVLRL